MEVYRIVQTKARTHDLSGTGAFQHGGRWNFKGTYMLYTASNSSLALLESMVHFDANTPPHLFLTRLYIDDAAPILTPDHRHYPPKWKLPESPANKKMGEQWMQEMKYLSIKVKSAVNELEYNYLLNPLFPNYRQLVKVIEVKKIPVDQRLIKWPPPGGKRQIE